MKMNPRIVVSFGCAAALAGIVAWRIVASRDSAGSGPVPTSQSAAAIPASSAAKASGGGSAPSVPMSAEQAAASRGQDVVMCRSLIQSWISALASGNSLGAERTKKAVLAYGPVAKEQLAWAIENLHPTDSIQHTLREAQNEIQ